MNHCRAHTTHDASCFACVRANLAATVHHALGLSGRPTPPASRGDGESDTRVSVWDIRELNAVYARTGGTVTARTVERTLSDGTAYTTLEVTVATSVDGLGEVQAFTDWEPDHGGLDLPVMHAATVPAAA